MPNRHHRVYLRSCPQINQLWPWLALLYNFMDQLGLELGLSGVGFQDMGFQA